MPGEHAPAGGTVARQRCRRAVRPAPGPPPPQTEPALRPGQPLIGLLERPEQPRQGGLALVGPAARRLAPRPGLERLVVPAGVAHQLAGTERLEAHRPDAERLRQRQDLGHVPRVHERPDREQDHVAHARVEGRTQDLRAVRRDPAEPAPPGPHRVGQLVEPAARPAQAVERVHRGQPVEHEQVGVAESEPGEGSVDLRADRPVVVVDLVDHEHRVPRPFPDRPADDFLGVPVLVIRGRVDHVQPGVDGPAFLGHARLDRHAAVGQVADAQGGCDEPGPTEFASGSERLVLDHDHTCRHGTSTPRPSDTAGRGRGVHANTQRLRVRRSVRP